MAEYELFVVTGLSELKQDEETVVEVRSVDTLEMRRVKAILSRSAKGLPGADTLWIRGERGRKYTEYLIHDTNGSSLRSNAHQG